MPTPLSVAVVTRPIAFSFHFGKSAHQFQKSGASAISPLFCYPHFSVLLNRHRAVILGGLRGRISCARTGTLIGDIQNVISALLGGKKKNAPCLGWIHYSVIFQGLALSAGRGLSPKLSGAGGVDIVARYIWSASGAPDSATL